MSQGSFDNQPLEKKVFWKNSTFWVIFTLVIFYPIGVILMWVLKKSWKMWVRVLITVIAVLLLGNRVVNPPKVQEKTTQVKQDDTIKKAEADKRAAEEKIKQEETAKKVEEDKKIAEEKAKVEAETAKKVEEDKKVAEEKAKAEAETAKKVEEDKKAAEEKAKQEETKKATEANKNAQSGSVQNTVPAAPQEHYTSCKEMRKVHPNGAKKGDAWYNSDLDRDKDGYACEK